MTQLGYGNLAALVADPWVFEAAEGGMQEQRREANCVVRRMAPLFAVPQFTLPGCNQDAQAVRIRVAHVAPVSGYMCTRPPYAAGSR